MTMGQQELLRLSIKSVVQNVSLTVSDWGRKSMNILHPCYLGLRGLPSLHGTPAATHRAGARTNLPDLRFAVSGLWLSCGADLGGLPAAPSMLRSASPLSPRPMRRELACLSERLASRRWKPLRS